MTDQEVIEYIKAHLRDYDKAFGSNSTLIGFWVENNPEIEAWAREVVEANTGKKINKLFLDDLAEITLEDVVSESEQLTQEQLDEIMADNFN